jgi:hypothetical protein
VKGELKLFGERIHHQLEGTEKEGKVLLASLRLKISKTFKEHSKQIITTRQIIAEMKESIQAMKEKIVTTNGMLSDMSKSFTS